MKLLICMALCVTAVLAEKRSYEGYHLLRVYPTYAEQVKKLKIFAEQNLELDFWSEAFIGRPLDINTPPDLVKYVRVTMNELGLTVETVQDNLQLLIDHTNRPAAARQLLKPVLRNLGASLNIVNTFPRYDEVKTWLEEMASTHPDLATIEDIGQTYEGREMRMIKIGNPDSKGGRKEIMWIDSTIHAREWLTVGTTIWIINKLLTTYGTDQTVTELLNVYDWYFLPVANPDGYEYTHTSDRLWRKTRSPNSWSSCYGTDPNRNWDAQWGVSGSSSNPCSSTYMGSSAFSEKCTQNMRDTINKYKNDIKMYMAVHSYSQMWLTPWAYGSPKPSDYSDLLAVANIGNAALAAEHGTRFIVGTPPDILYEASGGAYDWAKMVAGIKYAYTYELRPDGNAWNGFVVEESVIRPSGEEIWASLAAVAQELRNRN